MNDRPSLAKIGVPPKTPVAELTLRAVILGLVLSVVMGAANVYLGLKVGMTVSASIPAAVLAMLILRGLLRNGTILEANQVQTAASAGESLAAGIIFTMPALVLIGVWTKFDYLTTTLVAFSGGLLGILFMIPMRKVFVVSDDVDLKFPEGVACAAVLAAGDAPEVEGAESQAAPVIRGALMGLLFKLAISFLGLMQGSLEWARAVGERVLFIGSDVSPALVAVGLIVRLNVAVLIFIGGAIGWLIAIPIIGTGGPVEDPLDAAWTLWSTQVRYLGVGAMVVAGVESIWRVRGGLVRAVKHLTDRTVSSGGDADRDISGRAITAWSLVATAIIAWVYYSLTGHVAITVVVTVIMLVMSFFFTAVASYIVGLVGNSNSPVSGMTITAVLFTGAILLMFGFNGEEGMLATLGVAAVVCCAACTSGDVCNDLKTGQIVGASPYRQQMMQIGGVAVAALVMAPIMQLLHDNTEGGIGGKFLAAPQAQLFASLARGLFGDGQLPWNMVGAGAGLGVVIIVIDQILGKRGSTFRAHLMPIAVGIYLPFGISPPILAGGLIAWAVTRGMNHEKAEVASRPGVLFASGVIAGESLMGVGLALLASAGVLSVDLGLPAAVVTGLSVLGLVGMLVAFRRAAAPRA